MDSFTGPPVRRNGDMIEECERDKTMEAEAITLFNTFLLQWAGKEPQVRCVGTREIMVLDFEAPSHIRGIVEFRSEYIPLIDVRVQLGGEATAADKSSCILIVEHLHEFERVRTGILISKTEEIFRLAAGYFEMGAGPQASVNMNFVVEMHSNRQADALLWESHCMINARQRRKIDDEDFENFSRICRGELARA
jgi:chemotaxis signal transduction protein